MFAAKARGGSWSLTVEPATALKIDFDLLLGILLPLATLSQEAEQKNLICKDMTLDHGSAERRFSLPTGYRLLNDLSSLKRPQRKNNLVTREGASSVRVRHVPILLEVDEDREEKEEVRKGNMTSAPMILQQTNGSSQKSSLRPPRFSLPSPSVTESAKVHKSF